METYIIPDDINVFGFTVASFPNGIGEAFDKLVGMLPKGDSRLYYGLSECTEKGIIYRAAAHETVGGEGAKYGFDTYTIEQGEYLAETVTGWMQKTASIKNVFEKMLKDERAGTSNACVEIYKNDDEMICLVKMKPSEDLSIQVEKIFDALIKQLSLFGQDEINKVPFEGSWTAGQLAQHMILSNGGFLQMLNGSVKDTERAPDEMIPPIRSTFLDLTTKMESPDFILPEMKTYNKAVLLSALEGIKEGIVNVAAKSDLNKTCTAFEIPFFGFLTRLEAIHFSMYHTQRHTHQLKNIYEKL